MSPWASWSDRVYGLLLQAYPVHFRARFGEAMRGTFQRDYARVRDGGRASLVLFWIVTIAEACYMITDEAVAMSGWDTSAEGPTRHAG